MVLLWQVIVRLSIHLSLSRGLLDCEDLVSYSQPEYFGIVCEKILSWDVEADDATHQDGFGHHFFTPEELTQMIATTFDNYFQRQKSTPSPYPPPPPLVTPG